MRAKFKVTKIEQTMTQVQIDKTKPWAADNVVQREVNTVHLGAVTDPANATWAMHSPGGSVSLTISNPDAVGFLKLGESYFIDFSPAPATEAEEK